MSSTPRDHSLIQDSHPMLKTCCAGPSHQPDQDASFTDNLYYSMDSTQASIKDSTDLVILNEPTVEFALDPLMENFHSSEKTFWKEIKDSNWVYKMLMVGLIILGISEIFFKNQILRLLH